MRKICALTALILIGTASVSPAEEIKKPENIIGSMMTKLVRGVTNVATCIVEVPKQTYKTVQAEGAAGYVVGPLKGVGMTFYRGVLGAAEAVFFVVPQPGYYDPMVDPEFVWQEWNTGRHGVTGEARQVGAPSVNAGTEVKK